MEDQQSKFEGWAVIEMMGHRREIGFVTTEYYGGCALFRVDTPEIPERETELKRPQYLSVSGEYRMLPAGAKIKAAAIPAKSVFVAPGSLYAMTPCTEETARKGIEEMVPRPLILLSIPEGATPQLPDHDPVLEEDEPDPYEDEAEENHYREVGM